jgi:hypothetical protein
LFWTPEPVEKHPADDGLAAFVRVTDALAVRVAVAATDLLTLAAPVGFEDLVGVAMGVPEGVPVLVPVEDFQIMRGMWRNAETRPLFTWVSSNQ